ncbi:MAG: mechanosensitive ion channel [Chloroflexota bacterium]
MEISSAWWISILENLPHVVAGIVIFIVSIYVARILSKLTVKGLKARETDREISVLIERTVRWGVIALGIVLALQQAGQDVSALLTGLGILGFTIGFALQDVSANFVAGVLLLIQQPFDIGDFIEVAGYDGKVLTVDLRATELLASDGRHVMIPNSEVFSNPIINFTRTERRRIALPIGIAYDSDLEQVRQVSLEAINLIPGVLSDPAPVVVFGAFGDTAINLTIYYWYSTSQTGSNDAKDGGIVMIKQAYDKVGIDMPYPTQKIIVKNPG